MAVEPGKQLDEWYTLSVQRSQYPGINQARALPSCAPGQCQVTAANLILNDARNMLIAAESERKRVERAMSQALWCDPGDHSFSAKDRAAKRMTVQGTDPESGEPTEETINVCGQHAGIAVRRLGRTMLESLDPAARAQLAREAGQDPEYVAWLERQAQLPLPGAADSSGPPSP